MKPKMTPDSKYASVRVGKHAWCSTIMKKTAKNY